MIIQSLLRTYFIELSVDNLFNKALFISKMGTEEELPWEKLRLGMVLSKIEILTEYNYYINFYECELIRFNSLDPSEIIFGYEYAVVSRDPSYQIPGESEDGEPRRPSVSKNTGRFFR